MIWNPFKPKPKVIETVRASSKKQREGWGRYVEKHSDLARSLNRPVPEHLQGRP